MAHVEMTRKVSWNVVRVTMRVSDANWANSLCPLMILCHMLQELLSRQVWGSAERASVCAAVNDKLDLRCRNYGTLDGCLSNLHTWLALRLVFVDLCQRDDLFARCFHLNGLKICNQLVIADLLALQNSLSALWAFDWVGFCRVSKA